MFTDDVKFIVDCMDSEERQCGFRFTCSYGPWTYGWWQAFKDSFYGHFGRQFDLKEFDYINVQYSLGHVTFFTSRLA